MIYLFAIILIIVYICLPMESLIALGVASDCLPNALVYHFAHASWLHLLINVLSLCLMFDSVHKAFVLRFSWVNKLYFLIIAYVGATLAGMITAVSTPTIGASGIIFFLLGTYFMLFPTWKMVKNYIYVFLAVGISIFFGKANVWLHVMSFIIGCLFIIICTYYDQRRIQKD